MIETLPVEVVSSLILYWIDSSKDFVNLDNALANRKVRKHYLECLGTIKTNCLQEMCFDAKSYKQLKCLVLWAIKRNIIIGSLRLDNYSSIYDKLLLYSYSHIKSLVMKPSTTIILDPLIIFQGFFPCIESLVLKNVQLLYSEPSLLMPLRPCALTTFFLNSCEVINMDSFHFAVDTVCLTKFYEWFFSFCPAITTLNLRNVDCMEYNLTIRIFSKLPLLQKFTLHNSKDDVFDNLDMKTQQLIASHQMSNLNELHLSHTIVDIDNSYMLIFPLLLLSCGNQLQYLTIDLSLFSEWDDELQRRVHEWFELHGHQLLSLQLRIDIQSSAIFESIGVYCTQLHQLTIIGGLSCEGMQYLAEGNMTQLRSFVCKDFEEMNYLAFIMFSTMKPNKVLRYVNDIQFIHCESLSLYAILDAFLYCYQCESFSVMFFEYDETPNTVADMISFCTSIFSSQNPHREWLKSLTLHFPAELAIDERIALDIMLETWDFHFPALTKMSLIIECSAVSPSIMNALEKKIIYQCPKLQLLQRRNSELSSYLVEYASTLIESIRNKRNS